MKKMTKEEKKEAKIQAQVESKKKGQGVWSEFKKFISRGNIIDMAVGVIMGSAFGAIVKAFTDILLSVCTWGVPGGLKGLVTVLPALNYAQKGVVGQQFATADLTEKTIEYAKMSGAGSLTADDPSFVGWQNTLISKYTLHGSYYFSNTSAFIDWGTLLNAIISFLVIAFTLFLIVKTATKIQSINNAFQEKLAKQQEEAWEKAHPEAAKRIAEEKKKAEEEAAAAKEAGLAKKPENIVLLMEIRDAIRGKKVEEGK